MGDSVISKITNAHRSDPIVLGQALGFAASLVEERCTFYCEAL